MKVEDILLYDQTIFKDITVFNPDYTPDKFDLRAPQMNSLALSIRPALKQGKPTNNLILGSCATGKTTTVRKIFSIIDSKYSGEVVCVYINCQLHSTKFDIFSQIHKKLFGHAPPETGVPFARVYNNIMNELYDTDRTLIVALDDINYLFNKNMISKVFYDILRAYESFEGVRTGIFAVLSDIEFRYVLDKNVGSIFNANEIVFKPYNYDEIFKILKERVSYGFFKEVIPDDLIEEIALRTYERGDIRLGIDLLRISGNYAEADASKRILSEHVNKAVKQLDPISLNYIIKNMSYEEQRLLNYIAIFNEDNLTSGRIYKEYNRNKKIGYTTFNRLINKLEFLRLIDTKYTGSGVKGNSRFINLRFDRKHIRKCLKDTEVRS